jgi:hypothetical protein
MWNVPRVRHVRLRVAFGMVMMVSTLAFFGIFAFFDATLNFNYFM